MNSITSKSSIQVILQVISVYSMLLGATQVSQALIGFYGSRRVIADMQGFALTSPSITGSDSFLMLVGSSSMPLFWGLVLFALSPWIAKGIQDSLLG